MKALRVILIVTVATLFLMNLGFGAPYISSAQSGPWTDINTWVGLSVPSPTDNVQIEAGHTVGLLDAGVTCNQLTVNGTLNPNQWLVTITTTFTVNSGGTIIVGSNTYGGSYSTTPTLNAGSTVIYNYSYATISSSLTYDNLTIQNNCFANAGGDLTVNGTLTVSAGCNMTPAGANNFIGGTGTLTGGGTVTVTRTSGTANFSGQYTIATKTLTNLTVQFTGGATQSVDALTYYKLNISNSNNVSLNGDVTVTGTLVLNNGEINKNTHALNLGNGATLYVRNGGLSGTPTFGTSVNITYAGTAAQQTNNKNEFPPDGVVNNLMIANSNGVTIDRDVTITGSLDFTTANGNNLLLGGNNLTLNGDVTYPGAGYCVVTNGSGMVIRTITNGNTFVFPIGPAAGKWNCVQLSNHSGSTQTYYGKVTSSVGDVGNVETTAKVTWHIYCTTVGASTDIQFHWFDADKGTSLIQGEEAIWQNTTATSGGTWTEIVQIPTRVAGTPNTTTGSGILALTTSTTRFTVGTPAALPVQMTSFTAKTNKLNTELQWSTATEKNCYGFEVERRTVNAHSLTINSWQKIGFVPGSGTSNSPHEYSFIDPSPLSSRSAYQLKQIDNDGSFEYSQSVEVVSGMIPDKFGLSQNYPNPFNPTTTITYALPEAGRVSLKVFDMLGKEVATLVNETKDAGSYGVKFNAANLSSGMYFYQLKAGNYSETKKFLLMK